MQLKDRGDTQEGKLDSAQPCIYSHKRKKSERDGRGSGLGVKKVLAMVPRCA